MTEKEIKTHPDLGHLTGKEYAELFKSLSGKYPSWVPAQGSYPNRSWISFYPPERKSASAD